jgi:hypothetical protein
MDPEKQREIARKSGIPPPQGSGNGGKKPHFMRCPSCCRGNLRERHPRSLGCGKREPLGSRRDPAEDASRIRVYPGFMARLRSQALNIAKANGVANIAQALWSAALDPGVTLSYRAL